MVKVSSDRYQIDDFIKDLEIYPYISLDCRNDGTELRKWYKTSKSLVWVIDFLEWARSASVL